MLGAGGHGSIRWEKFFQGGMNRANFESALSWFDRSQLDGELCKSFADLVEKGTGPGGDALAEELRACAQRFKSLRGRPSDDLNAQRMRLIGTLRGLVARASVHHLEPDLVILDEFQRFKDLLDSDDEGAQLAHAIFDHQSAKLLLLSATPYKMYTLPDEPEGDDHYVDFTRTVRFLAGDERAHVVERELRTMRESVLHGGDRARALEARDRVESELRRVMSRTERLSSTPDRDGMLVQRSLDGTCLTADDLRAWKTFDDVARTIDRHDVIEYWRSTPYPLNLMERGTYQVRAKFQAAAERGDADVARALSRGHGLLDWDAVRRYEAIDPGNAKMRGLAEDVLNREAWRLAWIPPSLPYYEPGGAYAAPTLQAFTKRLVFSAWSVVPKAVAVVLSYGAERRAMEAPLAAMEATGRERRTYDARAIAPPLQYRMDSNTPPRPSGMTTLALLYPSLVLARIGDPLAAAKEVGALPARREEVFDIVRAKVSEALDALPPGGEGAGEDTRWFWAAPFLLDRFRAGRDNEPYRHEALRRSANDVDDPESRVDVHQRLAYNVEGLDLGPRPQGLVDVLSALAVAGPGVCALRALTRVAGGPRSLSHPVIRGHASRVAEGLRSLFNKPEIVAVLRSEDDARYWRVVLEHCIEGNLQAVLDEYVHVLVEQEGLHDADRLERAEALADVMVESLSTRAATNVVEQVSVTRGAIELSEGRMSSHFAARYGRAQSDDKAAVRESTVRVAFNSPFRPFVLASTSVGQEGLDFHTYCHAIVHWNLPGNPVDLEQREGRVHRYKGHAVRKNVAAEHGASLLGSVVADPWTMVFDAAAQERSSDSSDITPYWVYTRPNGAAIERYVPALPLSREEQHYRRLQRTVGAYRMVIGQPRQDDLLRYVGDNGSDLSWMRIDLAPSPVEPVHGAVSAVTSRRAFDPEHDEQPFPPAPWGTQEERNLSAVLYNGGLLAINIRNGRGATTDEHRKVATRAGYPDLRGIAGNRARFQGDGLWVTHRGREELEDCVRGFGWDLPDDLAW